MLLATSIRTRNELRYYKPRGKSLWIPPINRGKLIIGDASPTDLAHSEIGQKTEN